MKRIFAACLLAVLTLVPLSANSFATISQLLSDGGSCTAFSINEKMGLWMTANHCMGKVMTIDGEKVVVAGQWAVDDVALVMGPHAKALRIADREPKAGDEAVIDGFPFGLTPISHAKGSVVNPAIDVAFDADHETQIALYDTIIAPGNSGSPVVSKGKVIGVLQFGFNRSALCGGVSWKKLVEDTLKYWN